MAASNVAGSSTAELTIASSSAEATSAGRTGGPQPPGARPQNTQAIRDCTVKNRPSGFRPAASTGIRSVTCA